MGSIQDPRITSHEVVGSLLFVGYEYDQGLQLDLYGQIDEEGHHVESVAVCGSTVEIVLALIEI